MKKLVAVVLSIALIAGVVLYIGSNLDSIVEGLIEEHGSAATQTPVNVAGVSINLSEASAGISSLSVGNPEGFAGNAIEMEEFAVALDASSLTSDVVVIENILVKGARLNIIQRSDGNNLQALMRNLNALASADSNESSEEGKKIIINRFTLEGAGASLSAPELDESREVTLPTINLRNIGTASGGATGPEIAQQVLKPLIQEALKSAAAQTIRDRATEALEDAAGDLLDGILGNDDEQE